MRARSLDLIGQIEGAVELLRRFTTMKTNENEPKTECLLDFSPSLADYSNRSMFRPFCNSIGDRVLI